MQQERIKAQALTHGGDDPERIGTCAVHFVDEGNAGYAVALHLAIDGNRLGLHARHGAEHHNRTVEDPQRSFDFDGEINVAGRVDEVDLMVVPEASGGC